MGVLGVRCFKVLAAGTYIPLPLVTTVTTVTKQKQTDPLVTCSWLRIEPSNYRKQHDTLVTVVTVWVLASRNRFSSIDTRVSGLRWVALCKNVMAIAGHTF